MTFVGLKPGTAGVIFRWVGKVYFSPDGSKEIYEMIGNHTVPLSEEQAHDISENIGLHEYEGGEPVRDIPYVWPGVAADQATVEAPVKTEPVRVDSRTRQNAIPDLLDDLCQSGEAVHVGDKKYDVKISQTDVAERLAQRIGTDHGTSRKQLRTDIKAIEIDVNWLRRKTKKI